MLTAKNLKGNWATLLLPIQQNDAIDYQCLSDEIDAIIHFNTDGIYSNGTAGEFHNQTEDEFDKVNTLLAEKCRQKNMRFQIGASHPSPIISLERVKRAAALKPDGIQVILPDWVKSTSDEDIVFLTRVAEAANGIPLILYNPPHAKKVLWPEDYWKFRDTVPQLIGVKLLSGGDEWAGEIKKYASHLSVFVPGHMLATGISKGYASGAYSNVCCIHPRFAQNWWQMMSTDIEKALDIEKRIQEFFKIAIAPLQAKGFSNPALDKFLAAVGNWSNIGTRLRWPYNWIDPEEANRARSLCHRLLPELTGL